jgi:hypothetical protein
MRLFVHLAGQIGIHPPAGLAILPRQATDSAIRSRARKYLGFVPFAADAEARLTASLAELALDGLGSAELVERAEAFLLAAHVVLPARAALERLVASLNRQALEALFTRIAGRFAASTCAAFDRLVGNADDDDVEVDGKSTVGRYRTPPASSMGRFTRTAGERLEEINVLLDGLPDLRDISHRVQRQLAELCRRYDGHALRRFPAAKRYSLVACFLFDRRQGLLDDMVQAHDNHMSGLMRRARHAAEADARQLRQAAEAGLVTLIDTGEAVFTGDREESVAGLRERIGADRLETALMACRAVATNDARGLVDAVIARYPDLRKSLPAFWSLPFTSDTGRDDLLAALNVIRRLDQGAIKVLPEDVPTDFVPAGWQKALRDDRGQLFRRPPSSSQPSARRVLVVGVGRTPVGELPHGLLCRSRPDRPAGRPSRPVGPRNRQCCDGLRRRSVNQQLCPHRSGSIESEPPRCAHRDRRVAIPAPADREPHAQDPSRRCPAGRRPTLWLHSRLPAACRL